jgi:DNA (cytosine-5)-methyltransferase 1
MKPKIVSVFSGVGGIDFGFEKAGFETVFASDIWNKACESLKANFPNSEIVCDTIENVDFKKIKKKHKVIDGLVGGPPCPPFSKSRFYRKEKERGIDDEDGFMTVSNYFRAVEKESERLGYKIFHNVLNAADFGVPQTRQRFICIGVKITMEDFKFPMQTHSDPAKPIKGTKPWVTCGDILNDIDFDSPEDSKMLAGSKHKDLLKLVPPGDNYLFFTKERNHPQPIFKWRSRYWSFLLKLSPERPSWTIQASHSNNMGPFHWKNRFLRIEEIKRIQSFEDKHIFLGSYKEQWRQIGNAVPPLLAYRIANEIKKQYFK